MILFRMEFSESARKNIKRCLCGLIILFILIPFGLDAQGHQGIRKPALSGKSLIPTIAGPDTACINSWDNVYTTEAGMTGYFWTVTGGNISGGDGTNSVQITWTTLGQQSVSVTYNGASMPATMAVTVQPILTVSISISASANVVCAGTLVNYTANVINGGTSPLYQWTVNGINVGTNSSSFTYSPANGDLVVCQVISSEACTNGPQAGSNAILMVVVPNLQVGVTISASANPVCQGVPVTFTATPFNGGSSPVYQWKVNGMDVGSNSPVLVYNPANGEVITCTLTSNVTCGAGNPATSNPITMTVGPAVIAGVTITASANPACVGDNVTLTATPSNGGSNPVYQWKVNGIAQGSGGPVFTFIPANGDVVSCQLTSNAPCVTGNPAASNTITMTINPLVPAGVTVAASSNPICLGNSVTFTATPINGGPNPAYQWMINGFIVGTNSPTYTYDPANGDVITCQLTSSLACVSGNPAVSAPVTMTVNPTMPVSVFITASSNPVCQGNPVTLTATPYNGGTNPIYTWKVNGIIVGTSSPTYTYIPVSGDIVICQMISNNPCSPPGPAVSNTIALTVSTNIPVSISISESVNPVCQGLPVTFTATAVNPGTSPVYQWVVNGVNTGPNSPVFTYNPVTPDVVHCVLTSSEGCAVGNPAVSNDITINIIASQSMTVGISIAASANPSCAGQLITYTATPVNGGTNPVFQWSVNGISVGTNSPTYSRIPTNGDVVKCILTSSYTCTIGNPATSNLITMSVNPYLNAGLTISASANPSCQGSAVTFTALPVNGGPSPAYQWKVNGTNVGTGLSTYTYQPVNGDVVSCQMVSNAYCILNNPVTSNSITMVVYVSQPVTITITASSNPACVGSQVTFTATATNAGSNPTFQWKRNGVNTGSGGTTFTFIPVNNDQVTCQLNSNATCVIGNHVVLSNAINMIVSSSLEPSVTISSSANPYCEGSQVTFTATPVNGGSAPSYLWKVNCTDAGSGPTLTYSPADKDFVTCRLTSNLSCASPTHATSNAITMIKNTATPVSVSVTASANPVCPGTAVTFTATVVNGGSAPLYQWKVNGTNVGTNGPAFLYIPINGDIVTCQVTSNAACASGNPAVSAPVTMNVSNSLPAGISIATRTNPFCNGSQVTITATATNGGSAPVYQWLINGIPVGANQPTYTFFPVSGESVSCQLTSNATCLSGPNPVMSNTITLTGAATLPVGISISASSNPVCQGIPVTFTSTGVNGGNSPSYLWKVNGSMVGSDNPSFTYTPANGDNVTCQLTSDLVCATGNPATSNTVAMTVTPSAPVSVTITVSQNPVCDGTSVTFNAIAVNGGSAPVYQWRVNCQPMGANNPAFTYIPADGDVVTCTVTSNVPCGSGSPAISNNINMRVNQILPVALTITPSVNPFCAGSSVSFTATPSNGGTAPAYQWKVNGVVMGTAATFSYNPVNNDVVTCVLTSNATCISGNPAVSNEVIMIANAGDPVSVTISVSVNPVCQGSLVLFTATPVNPGSTPTYQWKVNGIPTGTNSPYCQFAPNNNDVVTCQLTSSQSCATNNPATSNAITMTTFPANPVSISITASSNPSCEGNVVQFNASITNGGSNPQYQWFVNNANVGTNIPQYSYVPVNGEVVKCRLFSNVSCPTNNPAFSNLITMMVSPNAPASVTISASANPVCQGTSVTFTATPYNGGTAPSYQWKVNGLDAGTNSPTFTYIPLNGDAVTCQMLSNSICTSILNVTSNTINMTVSPLQPVSITITPSFNPICIGNMVTFTSVVTNGGSSPLYQWKINGIPAGTNSPTFTYMPSNGDQVSCVVTSNATCTTNNPATSNVVTMLVVQSLPVTISVSASSNPVCQGQPVAYSSSVINGGNGPAYQWMVNGISVGSNAPVFTYEPSSGDQVKCQVTSSLSCATGNPATSNIVAMAVNPNLPVGVTISSSSNPSCQGTPVTFTAYPYNGGSNPSFQWKVNGSPVGSNSATYTYTPSNGNIVTCVVTSNMSCPVGNPATSNAILMNVLQPQPAGITITASANPVCPTIPVTFTATPVNGGSSPVYHWKVNGTNIGTSQSSFTYPPSNGDVITCELVSSSNCVSGNPATSNAITMVVNSSLPASVTIAASANPACQGQTVTFTATPVNGGNNPVYEWMVNGILVGINNPQYSYIPTDGDIITCHLVSSYPCDPGNSGNSNQIVMSVAPEFPVSVSITAASNPSCVGTSVTFTATPVNGGTAPLYQWKVNGLNVGMNSSAYTYVPQNGDMVSCSLTSNSSCVTGNPAMSNVISMIVGTSFPISVTISASANQVCEGTPVTFTAFPINIGASPQYQWKVNGSNAGPNGTVFTYTPLNGDVVTCVLTSSLVCGTGNPATSNAITMVVGSSAPPGVSIAANPSNSVCEGTTVTFNATATNGGSSPSYQWYKNGLPVGTSQTSYSCIPVNGDQVYVVMTSSLNCNGGNTATSGTITMTVNPVVPVSVSISASQNNICAGTSVTFTATPTNGGTSPVYQWYKNGSPAGTNQATYTYVPANGDQVYVIVTSSLACTSGSPATSNTITMTVNPLLPVSVSISASQNNICAGTSVTFTATATNGGTSPVYQWYKNGSPAGTNQATYSYVPANGDQVYVIITSSLACTSGNPATSNTITMTVNPVMPVSVSVTASQNNICAGTSVTFTATATNGGTSPFYQWYKNGSPAGTNQATYSYVPANGDQVYVIVTSSLSCTSGNPATSNTITMTVNPIMPVSVSITASQNNICAGTSVTFTASATNGGTSPVYQWYKNGSPAGTNQATYSYVPANGDQVYVIVTSSLACTSGNPATSGTITMTVNSVMPVSVSVTASQNNICEGTSVTFTATATNGGTSPVYQWYKNGSPAGTNQATYSYVPANGDQVYVIVTSSLACTSGNPATSNTITMTVNPVLPVSVTIAADQNNVCEGTMVTMTATAVNGGTSPVYQWYKNGSPAGTNQATYSYVPANGDQVYVVVTSSLACTSGSPATSNTVTMTVNPLAPVSVTITVDQNNVCEGTTVTFTASGLNGGSSPVYQWYKNGVPVGSNQPIYSVVPANNDLIYVVLTSSLQCVSGSPAMSNTVTMVVNPLLVVSVTITSDQNDVCEGTTVTFNATAMNGGTSPSYQWYLNGVAAGTNQPAYTCVPVNGDLVYVVVTSSLTCASGNPATSNTIAMVVYPIPDTPVVTADGQMLESSALTGNQWYHDGVLIPGATAQTYFAVEPGWYWVIVTLNGCSSAESNHVYVAGVGIDDKDPGSKFMVYPVPNDGRFKILISIPSEKILGITVYNDLGSKIYELKEIKVNGVLVKDLDLRPLPNGIYSVVFSGPGIRTFCRIVCINKN